MSARDRTTALVLVLAALASWLLVGLVFTTLSPLGNAGVQLLGALSLGAAVGLTVSPVLWAATPRGSALSFGSRLGIAGRRTGLVALVVSILVVLRALDAVSLPVVIFLVLGAVLVEVAVSLHR